MDFNCSKLLLLKYLAIKLHETYLIDAMFYDNKQKELYINYVKNKAGYTVIQSRTVGQEQ